MHAAQDAVVDLERHPGVGARVAERLSAGQVAPADVDHALGRVQAEAGGHHVRSAPAIDGGQPAQPQLGELDTFPSRSGRGQQAG